MEYTPDLEKRVQQGKGDPNPQHDVMKLRVDKGKYLYFVPRYDEKYEFCSNDPFIQELLNGYKTQVLNKITQGFFVLNRVKSDLQMTNNQVQSNAPLKTPTNQPQNTTQPVKTEPQVPFNQSRLARAIKGLSFLDLKTLKDLCLRHKYTLDLPDPMTHPKPHSNPSFDGGVYLHDTLSGKWYAFNSDMCDSKKGVQQNICGKLFNAARSNSNTIGEPTKEQQENINIRQQAEQEKRARLEAEQNRFSENQKVFETKKQRLIADLQTGKIDVGEFKSFREASDTIHKNISPTLFYAVLDEMMANHPEIKEPMTKTFVATYGFAETRYCKERSQWNSESENFFLKNHDCLQYVRKEFDDFVEPYKEKLAQQKALDEFAPSIKFYLDLNDGAYTRDAYYHTINKEYIERASRSNWHEVSMAMGDDIRPARKDQADKIWNELDVVRDEHGEKIDEISNRRYNDKMLEIYGVNLYQEAVPTEEQKQYAQEIFNKYKIQGDLKVLKKKRRSNFMSENSISAETPKEDLVRMINKMEVIPSQDNANQIGFNRQYTFKNEQGNEYELKIIDNQDKTLSVEFGPFGFSAKLTSVKENYDPNDGVLNKVFEHELKQVTNNGSHADAVMISAALRKVGVLGHPNTIKKKIKEGVAHPIQKSIERAE